MYERFYGLRERPFSLTPNPRYLLLTSAHAEALGTLQYGISSRASITVLAGEAGTGKTTVIRSALASLPSAVRVVSLTNPLLTRTEFVEYLALGFGLTAVAAASKPRLLAELTRLLEAEVRAGRRSALVVDEAHALPDEILEEIRLLANIETDDDKMLPIVLAGQPELADRLNEPRFRQLKQRVALRCVLGPLRLRETATYLAGRIGVAGGEAAALFTKDAVELVHEASLGLPRTINVICDNALVAGFAANERPVGAPTVRRICHSLDLPTKSSVAAGPRRPQTPGDADVAPSEFPDRASDSRPQARSGSRAGSLLHQLFPTLWVM
jgi:general secretion pathway protein A